MFVLTELIMVFICTQLIIGAITSVRFNYTKGQYAITGEWK